MPIFDTVMNLAHKIYEYLKENAPDYDLGISYLRKTCKNQALIKTLSMKENTFNRDKLMYELNKYLKIVKYEPEKAAKRTEGKDQANEIQAGAVQPGTGNENYQQPIKDGADTPVHHHDRSGSGADYSDYPDQLVDTINALVKKRNELYGIRDHLHAQLTTVDSEEKRYELAQKIHNCQPKIDQFNRQIATIKENGIVPQKVAEKQLSVDDYKRLKTVKTYISKYKGKINNAKTSAEKIRFEAHLKKYLKEEKSILNG